VRYEGGKAKCASAARAKSKIKDGVAKNGNINVRGQILHGWGSEKSTDQEGWSKRNSKKGVRCSVRGRDWGEDFRGVSGALNPHHPEGGEKGGDALIWGAKGKTKIERGRTKRTTSDQGRPDFRKLVKQPKREE